MLVSACLMIRDENEYLEEWLLYHHGIGVDKFYIYDNKSKNPVQEFADNNQKLKDLDINVFWWNHEGAGKHVKCFNDLIKKKNDSDEWCCFIDIDEFIVPTKYNDIKELIDSYKDYSAIKISRYNFGDSGFKEKPNGWVTTNFLFRCDNEGGRKLKVGGKSIVNLKDAIRALNPHNFKIRNGVINLSIEEGQINHYFTKSEEEWVNQKMKKGGGNGAIRDIKRFNRTNKIANHIKDTKILNYIDYVK